MQAFCGVFSACSFRRSSRLFITAHVCHHAGGVEGVVVVALRQKVQRQPIVAEEDGDDGEEEEEEDEKKHLTASQRLGVGSVSAPLDGPARQVGLLQWVFYGCHGERRVEFN